MYKEIQSGVHDAPILVMYPRHYARNALIALILRKTKSQIYYYPLREEDTTLRKMLGNLVNDAQFPSDFGAQTTSALKKNDSPQGLAEAFAADLKSLRKDQYFLALDELDRIPRDSAELDSFFRVLAEKLPKNVRVLINGREMFRQPWNDLILNGLAATIGENNAVENGIFTEQAQRGQIEFYSLSGSSRLMSDGRAVHSWDGSLPRNLAYYFIDHHMVTRDEIFRIFWPHLGVKEATNVFHVTKRKISEKLGYEITAYSGGFYVPSPRVNIMYDAREFEKQIEEALAGTDDVAPAKWYRAVQLYRHPYLEGLDMPWMLEKREKLRNDFAQALIGLGRMHRALGELDRALGYFLRAVAEKPDREDVHRNIMTIYHEQGRIKDVQAQYKLLESTLKRTLGIAPSTETRAMLELYTSN
ncbi:MAG: bacterial transcriptional activator domain-containing protein [Anaerolineae bacterium]|nr:bacterial transcriptional activator domain-containing protein [Anaerolineae bacterium]